MRLIVTYFDFDPDVSGTTNARSKIIEVDCPKLEKALADTQPYREIRLSYELAESPDHHDATTIVDHIVGMVAGDGSITDYARELAIDYVESALMAKEWRKRE